MYSKTLQWSFHILKNGIMAFIITAFEGHLSDCNRYRLLRATLPSCYKTFSRAFTGLDHSSIASCNQKYLPATCFHCDPRLFNLLLS